MKGPRITVVQGNTRFLDQCMVKNSFFVCKAAEFATKIHVNVEKVWDVCPSIIANRASPCTEASNVSSVVSPVLMTGSHIYLCLLYHVSRDHFFFQLILKVFFINQSFSLNIYIHIQRVRILCIGNMRDWRWYTRITILYWRLNERERERCHFNIQ